MPSERSQLNVRLPEQTWLLLDRLRTEMGLSYADLVQQGIRLLARRELDTQTTAGKNPKKSAERG